MRWGRMLLLLFLPVLLAAGIHGQEAVGIEILSLGAVLRGDTPIVEILEPEPGVRQTLVPTRRASEMDPEDAKRYVRLYFPKTFSELVEHEFIIYVAAPDVRPLTTNQMNLLRRASDQGVPALADQGGISGYEAFEDAWMASGLHEIFPNDALAVVEHGVSHSLGLHTFTIALNEKDDLPPVLTPFGALGMEKYRVSHGFYVVPKQGATIWADMEGIFPEQGGRFPWLMSMPYGDGSSWNIGDNFVSSFWSNIYGDMRNPYRTDILMNIILHATGRDLPSDILVVHRQRVAFAEHIEDRRYATEVIEFSESFGAKVGAIYDALGEMDEIVREARQMYIEQDYEGSRIRMAEASQLMATLVADALRAKDRALAWVYTSEWLAITGTSIMVGWVVYILMIRRRLYSEAGRTVHRGSV